MGTKTKILMIVGIVAVVSGIIFVWAYRQGSSSDTAAGGQPSENQISSSPLPVSSSSAPAPVSSSSAETSGITEGTAASAGYSEISKNIDVYSIDQEFSKKFPAVSASKLALFTQIASSSYEDVCEQLNQEDIDHCRYYYAFYRGNKAYCDEIAASSVRLQCYQDLVLPDIQAYFSACSQTGDDNGYYNCLNSLFIEISDPSSCSIFSDAKIRTACADTLALRKALDGSGQKKCTGLSDSRLKSFCPQAVKD